MKNFIKDLESTVIEKALNVKFPYACPECKHEFKAQAGKNICPSCGVEIDLKVKLT